jgi:hypothetical protein
MITSDKIAFASRAVRESKEKRELPKRRTVIPALSRRTYYLFTLHEIELLPVLFSDYEHSANQQSHRFAIAGLINMSWCGHPAHASQVNASHSKMCELSLYVGFHCRGEDQLNSKNRLALCAYNAYTKSQVGTQPHQRQISTPSYPSWPNSAVHLTYCARSSCPTEARARRIT